LIYCCDDDNNNNDVCADNTVAIVVSSVVAAVALIAIIFLFQFIRWAELWSSFWLLTFLRTTLYAKCGICYSNSVSLSHVALQSEISAYFRLSQKHFGGSGL